VALGAPIASDNSGSVTVVSIAPARLPIGTTLLDWETLTNYAGPFGTMECLDLCATKSPGRYYRAVWTP
jgi:hypothetical protein